MLPGSLASCRPVGSQVRVKDIDSHSIRALLASWALLVKIKRNLENQIRGLFKNLGLVIGRAS
jgi:transposase